MGFGIFTKNIAGFSLGETRFTDESVPLAVPPPPPPRNVRRILRVVGWNLLFILAGLLLIGIAGEVYLRVTVPFTDYYHPFWRFVPGVGMLNEPNAESRFTNNLDFWMFQRANSLGFWDREPIASDDASESCHITVIGDSFVAAKEVPVSDKIQVRLEEIAVRETPHLNVTTSAFGVDRTGQVNQLSLYDGYARHMNPDLVVLVFVTNDLENNSAMLYGLRTGNDPNHLPYAQAYRGADGLMSMRPPDPDFYNYQLPQPSETLQLSTWLLSWATRELRHLSDISYFARWMDTKYRHLSSLSDDSAKRIARVRYLMEQPDHAHFFEGRDPAEVVSRMSMEISLGIESAISREAWDATKFGLEQFRRRADHDGAALVLLTVYDSGGKGSPVFDRLASVGASMDIPVVSQHDYIADQGGRVKDAHWSHDGHWSPAGHLWAAEAVWEYIKTEWNGECPSVLPQPHTEVDWIRVGRYFHTHKGEMFVESFPALNPTGYESVYSSVTSGTPIARLDWDVYLYSDGMTYVKDGCVVEDIGGRFFLHVFPTNEKDLPYDRRPRGFDDVSFNFYDRGERFEDKCIASIDLPEYDISSIRTGQTANNANSYQEIWKVSYNFALPEILDAVNEFLQSEREPVIRSSFDVYMDDGRLLYVKSPCNSEDSETTFFLHVFPADENDLAEGREESGFDNLDFELMQNGGESDGACFAAVDFPEYEIDYIRTGQWVRGKGNVWEASIEFEE